MFDLRLCHTEVMPAAWQYRGRVISAEDIVFISILSGIPACQPPRAVRETV